MRRADRAGLNIGALIRRRWPELLLGLLPLVLCWPLPAHLGTHLPRSAAWFDGMSLVRIVAERAGALLSHPWAPYEVAWFHPHPAAVTLNEPYLTHALASLPLMRLDALPRYNLLLLGWLALCGIGMYRWLLALWGHRWAALVIAPCFAYGNYAAYQLGRVGHLAWGLAPLCLLALWRVVEAPSWRRLWLAVTALWLCFHASLYTGIYLAIAVGVGVLPFWLWGDRRSPPWIIIGMAVLSVLLLWSLWPWIAEGGAIRSLAGLPKPHRIGQLSDLLPGGPAWLGITSLWPTDRKWSPGTHFPGWLVSACVLWALVRWRRPDARAFSALGIAGVGLVLFLAPPMPGPLSALRDTTRAFPVLLLGLCSLAAWPLSRCRDRGWAWLGLLAFALLSSAPAPVPLQRVAPAPAALAELPEGAVALLPMKSGRVLARVDLKARNNLLDLTHGRPSVMNKSSFYPPFTEELWRLVAGRVSPDVLPLWQAAGVRSVVAELHKGSGTTPGLDAITDVLTERHRDAGVAVFELAEGHAQFADAPALSWQLAQLRSPPPTRAAIRAGDALEIAVPGSSPFRAVAWLPGDNPLHVPRAIALEVWESGAWRQLARRDHLLIDRRVLRDPAHALTWLTVDAPVRAERFRIRALQGTDKTPWRVGRVLVGQ